MMVGATGFEPATSTSRTWRATNCATPRCRYYTRKPSYVTRGSRQTGTLYKVVRGYRSYRIGVEPAKACALALGMGRVVPTVAVKQ